MGRPPIGKQAMTSTERSRRRRARLHADQPATKPDASKVTTLKARIAELEARNDQLFRQVKELMARKLEKTREAQAKRAAAKAVKAAAGKKLPG